MQERPGLSRTFIQYGVFVSWGFGDDVESRVQPAHHRSRPPANWGFGGRGGRVFLVSVPREFGIR